MRVFLTGMPACGKTTWGKKLANKLSVPFFDLDQEIEKQYSHSVYEIFQKHGEDYFRRSEAETLKKIIAENDSFVLSLGGGTPYFHNNMAMILSSGISVYLALPLKTLVQRIKQGKGDRPLFTLFSDQETEQKMAELFREREPYYLQSNLHVNALNLQIDDLISQIRSLNQ